MAPLNFPCPSCGSMVSTVGLAPGAAPFCSGCGRTFPVPASQGSSFGTGTATGAAGCVAAGIGLGFVVVFAGIAFMFFAVRSERVNELGRVQAEAQGASKQANTERVIRLAAQLEDPDPQKSMDAWHAIASCDSVDHWGTFEALDRLFRSTHARNALWNVSCGFQMYYDQRGKASIARELAARKASDDEIDLLCQSLEQYPQAVDRDFGAQKASEVRGRALQALQQAETQVDRPKAKMRIGLALERLRSQQPAERR